MSDDIEFSISYEQLEEAEAEVARLRAALEEIASHWDGYVLKDLSAADVMDIVRRGLTLT
jgi:hypothetical protein